MLLLAALLAADCADFDIADSIMLEGYLVISKNCNDIVKSDQPKALYHGRTIVRDLVLLRLRPDLEESHHN